MDALVTIVAPVGNGDIPALEAMIHAFGNPARPDLRAALDALDADGSGTHFISLHAIPGEEGRGHLVLEFTGDGAQSRAIERVAAAIGGNLEPIFATASDWRGNVSLLRYLRDHVIPVGPGLFDPPGLCFAGTPGMSVGRIRDEAALARFVGPLVDDGEPGLRPIDRLARVRRTVAESPFAWALETPPAPLRSASGETVPQAVPKLLPAFVSAYLWPFYFVAIALFGLLALLAGWHALWLTPLATIVLVAAFILTVYLKLRRQEATDWVDERSLPAATMAEIRRRENHGTQNHMISVTTRKPGWVRALTLRLAFWLIGKLAGRVYEPGHLGDIATIHAARWITIPGTRQLVFCSNFGGSWESYLEDFITRAHNGLTGVWSNSIGFPRAKNLFADGATDGERFKRYARASMVPTRFWYSAYPDQTTDHVRCNAAMRRGLAAALTNDEAAQWLALFGSAPRPDLKMESAEIQSLVFGGLGFLPHGACLLYRLPDSPEQARAFMAAIHEHVAFGDGRKLRRRAVLTVALGGSALPRLGVPEECARGFPAAFLEGMRNPPRARILGDVGESGPEHWDWGDDQYDLALLAYGRDEEAIARLENVVAAHAGKAGMAGCHRIPLVPTKKPAIEPFGFVDGVSQPVIRGSYQSFRKNDPIQLVEPGEFVIGYPDNRGNFPPEPELSPLADPNNLLPVAEKSRDFGTATVEAPRAVARNGTFLVIRQLEQDVKGFWDYCWSESRRLQTRLPPPYDVRPDFIAAKLVGRWRDGSSLVRNPYYPYPKETEEREKRRDRRETAEGFDPATAVAAAGEPVGSETARPRTNPSDGAAIEAPADAQPEASPTAPRAPRHRGDNDFLFGVEDPQALRCPYGAHIRRANPRDSLMPGSMEQVAISNRHRIYRVGRLYKEAEGRDPGLLFMCLNGDIERQFEFIQQTWLVSPAFHGLAGEQDPLTSNGSADATGYVVPTMDGPMRLKPLPQFVKTLGGGYFFMPGRATLAWLGGL